MKTKSLSNCQNKQLFQGTIYSFSKVWKISIFCENSPTICNNHQSLSIHFLIEKHHYHFVNHMIRALYHILHIIKYRVNYIGFALLWLCIFLDLHPSYWWFTYPRNTAILVRHHIRDVTLYLKDRSNITLDRHLLYSNTILVIARCLTYLRNM